LFGPDGLTFVFTFFNNGPDAIERFTAIDYGGFAVDAGVFVGSVGNAVPAIMDRSLDGEILGFQDFNLGLGVLVGVVGVVQWIGMEKLFMSHDMFRFTRLTGDIRAEAFRPFELFADSPLLLVGFYIIRLLGASLLVPVMEELFWRDYLWRSIASPNDFRLHGVGEYDRGAFWLVPLVFAMVHPQWLTSIVWALMIAWLLVRTRSLGACIVAHGVTNFLLGAYVLISWYGFGRDEWFFW